MTAFTRIGSVSEGTLRTEDLIEAFAAELHAVNREQATRILGSYQPEGSPEDYCAEEDEHDMLDELMCALDAEAPPYCYFGAHHGDGASFGFWIGWEEIEMAEQDGTIVRVDAGDEWPEQLGEGVEYVLEITDHGNATLYDADSGDEVWAAV
jgi:hypothetical protein